MQRIDVVCLCEAYDLKDWFARDFALEAPWIRLLNPSEVDDPAEIHHALTFSPAPDAFSAYPNLALVSSIGAGVDALLGNPSLAPHIAVSRVMLDEQAQMMAGFAIWHIVGWQRGMDAYDRFQTHADWQPFNRLSPSVFPVGVLGYGKLGAALAEALRGLGFPVTAYASRPREGANGISVVTGTAGLATIAAECRAVVNLLPLTDDTRGILDAGFFAAMGEEAILVNLGRGGHLVEADLIEALDRGRPGFAALDVFGTEPLPSDSPLWSHPKVRVTPHIAADADPAAVARFIAEGIARYERGQRPTGLVDRTHGY